MNNFEKIIPLLLAAEGGYVDDPSDAGGKTNFGISQKSYPEIDIENLTASRATEIYLKDFWLHSNLDKIDDTQLAQIIFFAVVHMGASNAIAYAQYAINRILYPEAALRVDGILGDKTASALNMSNPIILADLIRFQYLIYYTKLVRKNSGLNRYLLGWINRALI